MTPPHTTPRRPALRIVMVTGLVATLALTGCSPQLPVIDADEPITVGTTGTVTALDPAAAGDAGSFAVQSQVFPYLLASPYGTADLEPDIAQSAGFTSATEYTVVLKPDLDWANGNALTASDVVFSFDRQRTINAGAGAGAPLANLTSTVAVDETTVVFTLDTENDALFPRVLAGAAGAIVDEQTFAADALTNDDDIVDAEAFAGPYTLTRFDRDNMLEYRAFDGYQGLIGQARTENITVKYYADAANLKLDVQEGNIDVALGALSASDIDDLRGNDAVTLVEAPGGDIRFLAFDPNSQPFGAATPEADAAKALAVRVAVAELIDRDQLAAQVYTGSKLPLYSAVPTGLVGATDTLTGFYGDGDGGPDPEQAAETLTAAGITLPVAFTLHFSSELYGPESAAEYALLEAQLEATGAFAVTLQDTGAAQYAVERQADAYPVYQSGREPAYADADSYLRPVFADDAVVAAGIDPALLDLIATQATTVDAGERTALIEQIQDDLAAALPTLPLLQGTQVAVTGPDITGLDDTLDPSQTFRYAALTRAP
ncbi:peptide ABC transporter substrate-binding protein [Cryobacterium melibiosiphilum]|uniref:Peptide ABC transporter substrate-binding protein n=1 Tax=Cryobacterium melibiosiphilum TaxID=995039 RepID=A0A3A5MAT2_9MICO|nr:ABC transporter substrate-binding protein [Cryobacterium melibiosiphilum]RJT87220.1 peptide ABC transporter substrate-binding protein [Cryobacterium melibiosiphilum]